MIVNWNKPNAGVKVIPMQDDKGIVLGHITLVPGNNEVPDKEWALVKKNIANDPEREFIKEVVIKGPKRAVSVEGVDPAAVADGAEKEKGEADNVFPFKQILEVLKGLEKIDEMKELCKADTGNANLSKVWVSKYLSENENIARLVTATIQGKGVEEVMAASLSLGQLKAQQALEIVKDTFNLETLETWRKVESRDEIRAEIMNQIDAVNKPPRPGE